MSVEDLVRQLDEQREKFLALEQRVHNALQQRADSKNGDQTSPTSPTFSDGGKQSTIAWVDPRRQGTGLQSLMQSSAISVDSDDEDDETYYVRTPLPKKALTEDDLRTHLRSYEWDSAGKIILEDVVTAGRLLHPVLFQKPTREERGHISSYSVFDVGFDGSPVRLDNEDAEYDDEAPPKALALWSAIKDMNMDEEDVGAVGRIIIAQEPSPLAFAALHFAMNEWFDMDELFGHLIDSDSSSASPHRPFSGDPRHQRTFTFSFKYYTIIGEDRSPMPWQSHDKGATNEEKHLSLARCSSVVALSLIGEPVRSIRNTSRRKSTKSRTGFVYDPFSPWVVLNIQAYPDWMGSSDAHDATKHYVNGPEAFLATLLMEFRDARKRYEEIYRQITKMITPPADTIFDAVLRDERLFEDDKFTYTRGYFWAHQTFGAINDSIKAMIDAYEDTFTDDVWEGKHKSIWPLLEEALPRNDNFRRRTYALRKNLEREVRHLRSQVQENNERRLEIRDLRDQLFSGTSVLESRKSVELSGITILQGHNVKLLTLVNIFFLPLTFTTSVFGMTNMSTKPTYWQFGAVLACVCIPFFLLIGSLNTDRGHEFWKERCKEAWGGIKWFFAFLAAPVSKRYVSGKGGREIDQGKGEQEKRTKRGGMSSPCGRADSPGSEGAASPTYSEELEESKLDAGVKRKTWLPKPGWARGSNRTAKNRQQQEV
ncbi:uncharacterized protein J3D65DRAFT_428727 [Phyllosticta citribraziliensis]|uniref:Uncharacterized protein n=1 Tax=Phyllosticta citribraziliensis TaxID=989973 RepID=A0ABR1LJL5_9PEZI